MKDLTKSHLYQEIHQQPEVLARLLESERGTAETLVAEIRRRRIGQVVIAARGTSDNAARYAKYLFGAANGLVVALATPSLFTIYHQPPRLDQSLVLGISQSGKSPDIVSVVAEARRQGALTAAITNTPSSDLASAAEHVLDLRAGDERSLAATKTYTSQLATIALLSVCLEGDSARMKALQQIPKQVRQALENDGDISRAAERFRYMQSCVVIGRGYNYATAFELALKLKELTYTLVEPYSSADFMHGPLAMISPGFPVLVLAPSGVMQPEIIEFVGQVTEIEAEVVVISDDLEALALARVPLRLPDGVPEWLSPLTSIIPGQLLAMHLAHTRGYDPDRPRLLRKVTETR